MRNNYHFECGESDGKVYHSEKYRDAAACKAAAKQYCEDHKQDVKLYSSDNFMGQMYAAWSYNDGDLKYTHRRG